MATLMVGLIAATGVRAEGDAKAGQVKAIPCMGCHGIPGYSNVYPTYHVPRVGGQHPEYIVAALKAYKAKERSHPTMQAQAATLSEADMENLAAFFSTKTE
ncbi:MAG: cytochrome c [Lysobacterales bacterium]|nr:MAG: cytochrome c [Xanthomonadales bacterium]